MKHRQVEVNYRGKHEAESMRIVLNPLGIVVRTGMVYLVATSWNYRDVRHYVLHRMSEPRLTDEPAETPPDFRLADHLGDDGPFAYPASGDKLALRALFHARRRGAPDRKPPRSGPPCHPTGGRACSGGGNGGRHRRIALVAGGVREFGGGAGAGVVAGGVSGGGAAVGGYLRKGRKEARALSQSLKAKRRQKKLNFVTIATTEDEAGFTKAASVTRFSPLAIGRGAGRQGAARCTQDEFRRGPAVRSGQR